MIHFFCALPCEAKPLINHFKLKVDQTSDLFKIYITDDKRITLTICGIGKLNAASAAAYHCAHINPAKSDIWLNIGIAGHQDAELGHAYLANKITDSITQDTWYPQFIFKSPCKSLSLITLESPSNDYQASLFDMEASGFYSVASRIGTNELIHCFKVISDNATNDFKHLNAKQVARYIEQQIDTIESIINILQPYSNELIQISTPPDPFNKLVNQIHFTATEKIQLERLLIQWKVRLPEIKPDNVINLDMKAKAVLKTLANQLEASPLNFPMMRK